MSVTIVFRGLMVFHYMNDHMEIGVLNVPHPQPDPEPEPEPEPVHPHEGESQHDHSLAHVPRIITTKGGVISSIVDLRERVADGDKNWEIEVTNPMQPIATKFEQGDFNRHNHGFSRDFRWMTDLEADDLHDRDLTGELNLSNLAMILRVRHGEFYTHQLSRPLTRRRVNHPFQPTHYGRAAEVVGCDIAVEMGEVTLKSGNELVFTFDKGIEDGVVYEFSNAPPDVLPDKKHSPGPGHFRMYYTHLFNQEPEDLFSLIPQGDPHPAPDPALCGAALLGTRGPGLSP